MIIIGIGGSYLGAEYVYESLKNHPICYNNAKGIKVKFLANVDPIDFNRAIQGINVQQTMFIINSKTFTTAETILNAKTCKEWVLKQYKKIGVEDQNITKHHFSACSTNLVQTGKFGIANESVFEFWDWVGGRYSVCSAIGAVPISFAYGFDQFENFLKGCHQIDQNFYKQKNVRKNIPMLLGLIGYYRVKYQGYSSRAILPYCQALCKFVPHIQQIDMQSNGKRTNSKHQIIDYQTGPLNFGQPGTNGQHSFYQLLHQGRTIPAQFIGFTNSQCPIRINDYPVSNHEQLMSNFFSQPDALAIGKSKDELVNVQQTLKNHKIFPGDRPSTSLLFKGQLDARRCGMLLALYEHRTAVEGFLWDINSFDQMGVELGKVLAKNIRQAIQKNNSDIQVNSATKKLFTVFLNHK